MTASRHKYLFWVICAWYILLIAFHFYNQRPLWNDEQCVLNNIAQLTPHDVFSRGLISDQAFPRLYLWGIQQFSSIFNHALWSLRFFPFMCMMAAFFVWMRIACLVWSQPMDRFNFALSWAASLPLIYYAAELKQYSMDVLAGAVLVHLLLSIKLKRISAWWLSVFPMFGFFSYPVFFLMILPVYVLWRNLRVLGVYLVACALMVLYLWVFDVRHSAVQLLETYWHEYFISFASVPAFFQTLGDGINNLISRWFVELPKIFRAMARVFVGIGFMYMLWQGGKGIRKSSQWTVPMVAFLVFLELLVLGALRKFPFGVPRMSLFFAPMMLFCMVEAFARLRERFPKLSGYIQIALCVYLSTMSFGIGREIFHGDLGAQTIIFQHH